MEFFITLQDGFGDGILSDPAAIVEVNHNWEPEKLDAKGIVIFTEGGENTVFVEGGYQWHSQVRFFTNLQKNPGEQPNYEDSTTFQLGAEVDMGVLTLTADTSPDAFGAGKRVRFGIQSNYQITQRVSLSSHLKYRYLSRSRDWEPQLDVQVNYQLNERSSVFVKHTEHDFFDDATVIGYKLLAF